jgi:cysteinyl-tRNA synthetase
LLAKGFDPFAIRYLLLSAHYKKPLNFTLEGIGQAASALETLKNFLLLARTCRSAPSDHPRVVEVLEKSLHDFEAALDDNLNISNALAAVFNARYELNSIAESHGLSEGDRERILSTFKKCNAVLDVLEFKEQKIADAEVRQLIEMRATARRNRDFKKADEIRDELLRRGIALEDTIDGVRWKRVSEQRSRQ